MPPTIIITLVIATALFMEKADATIIATALPAIAADLGLQPVALKLALTSYLIALAIVIPASGWLADRLGARRVFCVAIGIFMAGSAGCAMAGSLWELAGARFVQGMGGALMSPVGRIVLVRSVERSQLVSALALLSAPALLGSVGGPLLGGLITTWFHWRWIFLVNLPIGLIGMLLAARHIPDVQAQETPPLDVRGLALCGAGLALCLFAVSGGGGVTDDALVMAGAAGTMLLGLYALHAQRVPAPLLRLSLLRIPTFRAGLLGGALFRTGAGAIPAFLLPLMLQQGFGMPASEAGAITFISGVGAVLAKTMANGVLGRFRYTTVLTVNGALASALVASYGFFSASTPLAVMLGMLFAGGCLRSLQFTALGAISYADVPANDMGAAASLHAVTQHVSLALGVALGALALQASAWRRASGAIAAADFPPAFLAVGLASLSSVLLLARLPVNAGEGLVRRRDRKPQALEKPEETRPAGE